MEVQKLCRGMINRGHFPVNLKQLFSEVSNNLKREKDTIGADPLVRIKPELGLEK